MRPLGFIMRRSFDQLVFASFLGHVVFGCCCHHVDAAPGGESPKVETSCPCRSHSETPDQPADKQPCERHGCDHQRCVFTRAESVDGLGLSVDLSWAALAVERPREIKLAPAGAMDTGRIHIAPAIRLHLLNQALLL